MAQLADLAEGGHHVRLSAPRRYGKTSLLYNVRAELQDRGLRCVYVDLYGAVSRGDVARAVRTGFSALSGSRGAAVAEAFREVEFAIEGRVPGLIATVRKAPGASSPEIELAELFDLPKRLFAKDGIRTVVIFDEFQELLNAGDRIDALLRSRIQHHINEAAYIYSGSHEGMMRALFNDKDRPLFRQARPIELPPLADPELGAFIESRFAAQGRDPGQALTYLLHTVGGHPQRAMQLAHHLFEATAIGEPAGAEQWTQALAAVFRESEPELQQAWAGLKKNERRVVTAASQGGQLLARDTLASVDLTLATASRVRDQLLAAGDLRRRPDGSVYVTDPLLGEWAAAGRRSPVQLQLRATATSSASLR